MQAEVAMWPGRREVVNSELIGPVVRWYSTVVVIGNHSCIWPQDGFEHEGRGR